MTDYHFTVIIEKEKKKGFHAYCPALPGCHTQGETYEETMKNITEAIQLYIESLKAHKQRIPTEDVIIKPSELPRESVHPANAGSRFGPGHQKTRFSF